MNEHILKAEYAVRGEIVLRANEHQKALERDPGSLPFDKVVYCNIGNPQSLAQKPVTFFREVLALLDAPHLIDDPAASHVFSPASVERARELREVLPSGTGAYSNSKGVEGLREIVAGFIERRDGHAADPEHIFLTDGASPAVQMMIKALIRDETDGMLIPIPQYPLYSAAIAMHGGAAVGYFLEEGSWGLHLAELRRALEEARAAGTNVRALAIINPGNPTGQCLTEEAMVDVVRLCEEENLVLLADEVYQENIWNPERHFVSFKKVACDLGSPVQLASMHSVSKGFLGECGRRGGYVEFHNIPEDVIGELYKTASVSLCSNVNGQVMTALMCSPPKPGDDAFDQYSAEKEGILDSLKRRARILVRAFRGMGGVSCQDTDGALYVFPKMQLPQRAIEAAAEAGKAPDAFYCLSLLDETGVVVVPGSGFGQREGSFHFRTTILPPEEDIEAVASRMADFHASFLARYGGLGDA